MNERYKIFYDIVLFSFYSLSFRSRSVNRVWFCSFLFYFNFFRCCCCSCSYRFLWALSLHSLIVILFVFLPLFQSNIHIYPFENVNRFYLRTNSFNACLSLFFFILMSLLLFWFYFFWSSFDVVLSLSLYAFIYRCVRICSFATINETMQLTYDLCNL